MLIDIRYYNLDKKSGIYIYIINVCSEMKFLCLFKAGY